MRTLCVAGVYPWPAQDGYRQRLSNMIEALAEAGPVDLVVTSGEASPDESPLPANVRLYRREPDPVPAAQRLLRWVRSDLPRAMFRTDMGAINRDLADWLSGPYDVCYISHAHSWLVHPDLPKVPTIVDLDNLDQHIIRAARTTRPASSDPKVWARWLAMQPVDWVDERRTETLQLRCAAAVDAVTLCSQLDVDRSQMANAVVIANGYERPSEPPLGRSGDTIVFVGALGYPPNSDAVRWFANDVLPSIRQRRPDATFRVIGGSEHTVADVVGMPGVEVLGRVADLQPELDAATIAVVPIRFGSGTRLKVIEALANRLPLVSTRLGSEGIDVVDGAHALLRDDAAGFADACVLLLEDEQRRNALAQAAEALWQERYRWGIMRQQLRELAQSVQRPLDTDGRSTAQSSPPRADGR